MFHWSTCLFSCQYHTVLITIALQYSLKSGSVMHPALFFFLKIALAALPGEAQLVGCCPAKRKVSSLIPDQGT